MNTLYMHVIFKWWITQEVSVSKFVPLAVRVLHSTGSIEEKLNAYKTGRYHKIIDKGNVLCTTQCSASGWMLPQRQALKLWLLTKSQANSGTDRPTSQSINQPLTDCPLTTDQQPSTVPQIKSKTGETQSNWPLTKPPTHWAVRLAHWFFSCLLPLGPRLRFRKVHHVE